ncbi:hypothetical protein BDW62DRAFT_200823 [Aspergillus aurantiobrunneus]
MDSSPCASHPSEYCGQSKVDVSWSAFPLPASRLPAFPVTGGDRRSPNALVSLLATCNHEHHQVPCRCPGTTCCIHGYSRRQQVEDWIAQIKAKYDRLDGAANIAGVIGKDHGAKAVADLDDNEWDRIIGVNFTGLMYCLRAELNHIVDGGSIVNMASIHATTGLALHGAYAANKHGVLGLTRAAAKGNGHREVRVNMMQGHWDRVSCKSNGTQRAVRCDGKSYASHMANIGLQYIHTPCF